MNTEFQKLCELFASNRNLLTKSFAWSQDMMNIAAALVLTDSGIEADRETAKTCEKMIKENKGALSEFRDYVKVPLICKMIASGNPEEYFKKVDDIYSILNRRKLFGNSYKIMAAMTICEHTEPADFEKYIDRTNEIYSRMNREHRILTSDEDIPFAAVLAASDLDIDRIITDMEACYGILKKEFFDKNSVQSVCEVLALSDRTPAEKCAGFMELYAALKKAGRKFGTGQELATLATLSMSETPVNEIIELIAQADDYLKKQRGFGNFTLGRTQRRMYAAQLAIHFLNPNAQADSIALGTSLALSIAMEVCMIVCITACICTNSH